MTIQDLVNKYVANRESYLGVKETQLRNDFIDPFLKCFGWDVDNEQGKMHFLRDVLQEESIEIEGEIANKSPDYTLRVNGNRKLFVEAKKGSVDILRSSRSAFQLRRYGWNANLGISILTNFEHTVIYDCRFKPNSSDDERVARVKVFNFNDYVTSFQELHEIISFDSAISGRLDDTYSVYEIVGQTFDTYFLSHIENWRLKLAQSTIDKNISLNSESLNFLVQRLLNRIIFLRICEDRTIEKYETLRNIRSYNDLKSLFRQSDRRYNSGLFDFIEDTLTYNIEIDSEILIEIFNELYYPLSPYDFSVVDPTILSQIYERFLGSRIVIDENRQLSVYEEPEISLSNGVVPTPKIIVDQIVKETLGPIVSGKSFFELSRIKIADICCGSGTFLISAYDFLLKRSIETLVAEGINDNTLLFRSGSNDFSLTLAAKKAILEHNIYGVDINPYAVEVAEFSLLLKLLEGENDGTINNFIETSSGKVLPSLGGNLKCGNSLVDSKFYDFQPSALRDNDLLFTIKPFDWNLEFPFLTEKGGFDAIIGNPPYVRIQKLVKYIPDEIKYYQSRHSMYTVAKEATIDKYYVFIERAMTLLNVKGHLGYIVPHKFFINTGGEALREFITSNGQISKLIHFGVSQVFPGRSTYTAIIIIQKEKRVDFDFKRVRKLVPEILLNTQGYVRYKSEDFDNKPWIFLTQETDRVFKKLKSSLTVPLSSLAEIAVGLQTSKDEVYIFKPTGETASTFFFSNGGNKWEIEKGICLPAIYKQSFGLFDTVKSNAQIIFPYRIENGKAYLYGEQEMEDNFGLAWRYLNAHKIILENRGFNGPNPKWYQFGRSQKLARFQNTPKLVWSVLSKAAPYGIDKSDIQLTGGGNGPYYTLISTSEYSLNYFLGILSHPLFERMVKAGSSEFRGEYYSHGKQFIQNLPIRTIDFKKEAESKLYEEITLTVEELIETKKRLEESLSSNKQVLGRKMDTLYGHLIHNVNSLYGIDKQDYDVVMNDDMFNELVAEV